MKEWRLTPKKPTKYLLWLLLLGYLPVALLPEGIFWVLLLPWEAKSTAKKREQKGSVPVTEQESKFLTGGKRERNCAKGRSGQRKAEKAGGQADDSPF